MKSEVIHGGHLLESGERFLGRTIAIAMGTILMIVGLGMGVTMVMLPIGLPLGLGGLLLVLFALSGKTSRMSAGASPVPREQN
jgi:hypothetical protein